MELRGKSEEKSIFAVSDDVDIDVLANHFHHVQIIGGDRQHDDAIVVLIGFLNIGQILTYGSVGVDRRIGR